MTFTTLVIYLILRYSFLFCQETLYYHGYTTSDITAGPTNERSTLPSLNLSDGAHARLLKGQCEQLPPLASPLVLAKRVAKEPVSVRTAKKVRHTMRHIYVRIVISSTNEMKSIYG